MDADAPAPAPEPRTLGATVVWLQALVRRKQQRKEWSKITSSVIAIQKVYRGHDTRWHWENLRKGRKTPLKFHPSTLRFHLFEVPNKSLSAARQSGQKLASPHKLRRACHGELRDSLARRCKLRFFRRAS